jgi:hypothetical protein
VDRIVVVFDICSSSVILEDLQLSGHQDRYAYLIDAVWAYLNKQQADLHFEIHKYLGDGFLLLFPSDTDPDELVWFLLNLTFFANLIMRRFKDRYLDVPELPRAGITIGVDIGQVYLLESKNVHTTEYFGRTINVASRLQSRLDQKEHANMLLVSREFYRLLSDKPVRQFFHRTTRALHNLANDKALTCYYLDFGEFVPAEQGPWATSAVALKSSVLDGALLGTVRSVIQSVQDFAESDPDTNF